MSRADTVLDPGFEVLLDFLRRVRGFDFTGYKRPSLERRIRRRMQQVGTESYGDYLDHLEVHPDEYEQLFDSILINVTEFFRDPPTWEHLRDDVLPTRLAERNDDEPIRVWSAGCATGQEPCTIAIVLAEILGERAFKDRVKIYATDVDESALALARHATYSPRELGGLPDELREKYFVQYGQGWAFRPDLRRMLIFGRSNLVSDAPISRLDLLVCRNTLMYLNAETQQRILRHFHFALRDGGVLVLGRSEMMTAHRELFAATDLRKRVFRRLPQKGALEIRAAAAADVSGAEHEASYHDRVAREAALELAPNAQIIVSRSGALSFANVTARALFDLGPQDLGRPLGELRLATEPVALARPVEQAVGEGRRVPLGEVPFTPPGAEPRKLLVSVLPLVSPNGSPLGASVTFEDVTRSSGIAEELERSRRDLEAAYEELESTIDELETTNEELQSANEELQTTNEELQSTNEELETMNEELQSTNEELETINDELRERTGELNRVNQFLEIILTALGIAVAVVDRAGRVQVWNHGAEELWGMRAEEAVDQSFLTLDIGLSPERLTQAMRTVIATGESHRATLEAVNRRGRTIEVSVSMVPLVSQIADGGDVHGAIVMMEDGAQGAEHTLDGGS